MNNIIVIYHSADFDGLFSREIARRFFGDTATYIGWDYGQPLPCIPPHNADGTPAVRLYMLDISIDGLMEYPGLTWIDHHKTAMAKFNPNIRGYRIDGVAACRLAWQWFFRDTPGDLADALMPTKEEFFERVVVEPYAVRLAGEYDIWDKRDPAAELFQSALRSRPLTDYIWNNLLDLTVPHPDTLAVSNSKLMVSPLLESGRAIAYAREQEYAQVITEQGFTISFEGLTFLACCSHECDIRSHLFAAAIRPEHDALMGFTFTGKDWRFSLYGVPGKPDIDLSVIAAKYGGGGHKQACGFRIAEIPFALPR